MDKLNLFLGLFILALLCVPSASFASTCDDMDGITNYDSSYDKYNPYIAGTVTYDDGTVNTFDDVCVDHDTVREYYCLTGDEDGNYGYSDVDCTSDYYCIDGKCELASDPQCVENYGVNSIYTKDNVTYTSDGGSITIFDSCKDEYTLLRIYCTAANLTVFTETLCAADEFCIDGVCEAKSITDSCIDSDMPTPLIVGVDNYVNLYESGHTEYYTQSSHHLGSVDVCVDDDTVTESFCDSSGTPQIQDYDCPVDHVCESGRCIMMDDLDCIDNDSPNEPSVVGVNYQNRYVYGSVKYIDGNGKTNYFYDVCAGQTKVTEAYCDSGAYHTIDLDCPEGYVCTGGQCTYTGFGAGAEISPEEKETEDCLQFADTCDKCLKLYNGKYCDCHEECSSGNCCDNTCESEECGVPENCTWSVGPDISGNYMFATPGKVVYGLEENTMLEITGGTGSTLRDAEIELYATDEEGMSIYYDSSLRTSCYRDANGNIKCRDYYTHTVSGYGIKETCSIDDDDCPANITIILPKGNYEAQPVLTSTFLGGLTLTTSAYGCVKKLKTNDCTDPFSSTYCEMLCEHCVDNALNCDEVDKDCGGSCISGTETVNGYAPFYELWGEDTSMTDDYIFDEFGIYFSSMFFCMDGIDNDKDCLTDCSDPDCKAVPFMDADGDGYGVGCGNLRDCDDTDPTETTYCDEFSPEINLTINANMTFTNTTSVVVNIFVWDDRSNPEDINIILSNDTDLSDDYWFSYVPDIEYNLTGPDGINTVYGRARDKKGNINPDLAFDEIILDTTPPILDITIIPNPATTGSDISFDVVCMDPDPPTGYGSGCNYTTVDIIYPYSNFESTECDINYSAGEASCDIKYVAECEDMSYEVIINTTDNLGNLNSTRTVFQVKKKEGCPCVLPEECISNSCPVQGFCSGDMPAPSLSITEPDGYEIPLGETRAIHVAVTNNLPVKDTLKLNIYSDSSFMTDNSYFSKNSESRIETYVELDPMKTEYVTMYVFGGKLGTYSLMLDSESMLTHLKAYDRKTIHVVKRDDGSFFSRSPGLDFLSVVLLVIVSACIYGWTLF